MRFVGKYAVGIAVSAVALWLAVLKVDLNTFLGSLQRADILPIILAFLITQAVCLMRVGRWRILFSFAKRVPSSSLLSVLMIGFLANNLLPARMGDVSMAFLLHHKEGIGKSRAMGAIFLDRLFDVIALVSLMGVVLLVQDLPDWVNGIIGISLSGCAVGFATIWLLVRNPAKSRALAERLMTYIPARIRARLMQVFVMALEGMSSVANPGRTVLALLVSLAIWMSLGFGVYLLTTAYGFGLSYFSALIVMGIVNLGLIIPSSPGFVGTFQLFCVAALSLFSIDKSSALSFSVIYHLSQWLPTTIVGYYFLNRENLKLATLKESKGTNDATVESESGRDKP